MTKLSFKQNELNHTELTREPELEVLSTKWLMRSEFKSRRFNQHQTFFTKKVTGKLLEE
jgi:hypothetical protein